MSPHQAGGLGGSAKRADEVAPAPAPSEHVAVNRDEGVVAVVGALVRGVVAGNRSQFRVVGTAQVGVGAAKKRGITAEQPFYVRHKPERARPGFEVGQRELPDLDRFVRRQEDAAFRPDAVVFHDEAGVAKPDVGREGGTRGFRRKEAGGPESARLGIAHIKIPAPVADQADPAKGVVIHQGLVVEDPVSATELVESRDESVVPEVVHLNAGRSQGISDDVFEIVLGEMTKGALEEGII